MPLIDRIEKALDNGVDTDVFERAAVALLQSRYPWLSPVEAGKDLGRDADIYRVVTEDPESRGRLLVTTGDPLANLKASHKSWQKETDFRVDELVIACSRDITASTRKRIDQYCRDHGLPLPEYYGRDWVVNALIGSPNWREALTGVRGRLDSLRPATSNRFEDEGSFVGRVDLLSTLISVISEDQDVVLSGVPGVGKSRLLQEVGGELFFVEPNAKDYLADDLLAMSPRWVALDDAHLHLDVLVELVRLRVQEGLAFVILASTWPEEAEAVAANLPAHRGLSVDLLARGDMDAIVQSAGVTSVHARHLVLDQAEGRPGWARSLCEALVEGNGDRVASGEVLLDQVERYLRAAADSATTLDAVACIAALGGVAQDDLERISNLVKKSPATLLDAVHAIATSGLLDYNTGRWHLQPALRAPLVSRWFFGPRKSRSWRSIVDAFPERKHELTTALLSAAHASPGGEATQVAQAWAAALPPPNEWDEPTLGLARDYAALDQASADFASLAARSILSTTRPTRTAAWGTIYDPLGTAARGVLVSCVHRWLNKEAVHGLLDLGLDDDRARPQHTDHPLRVLGDMAHHLDPDRGPIFDVRQSLITYAKDWLETDTKAEGRWDVFAEIVRYCFSPAFEGTWTDPAANRSITIANGVESPDHLQELIEHWGQVDTLLSTVAPDQIPVVAIRNLVELLEEWLRLAGGHASGTASVSREQRDAGAVGSWTILGTLRPFLDAQPGLALRAQQALDLAGRWEVNPPEDVAPLTLDDDMVLFAGRREPWDSAEDWIDQRDHDQAELAERLLRLGPRAGTDRFVRIAEASATSGHAQDGGLVALRLAQLADNPADWIQYAAGVGSAVLLYQTIREARQRDLSLDRGIIESALHDPKLRGAVVGAVLDGSAIDPLAQLVISDLNAADVWQMERMFTKSEPDQILQVLLQHPVKDVRAAASLAFDVGVKHGTALPDGWVGNWEQAFLDADSKTVHGHLQWRLQEMLKTMAVDKPKLCADWFERRLLDDDPGWSGSGMRDVEHVVRGLPQPQRERLARLSASNPTRTRDLLPHLLGHDADLAARLLGDGTLDAASALDALSGQRDGGVEILVPVLLAHGVPAARIARRVCGSRAWRGNESDAMKADIQWLKSSQPVRPHLSP
jgi:hypothetical protein